VISTRPFAIHAAGVFGVAGATVVRVVDGQIAEVGGVEVVRDSDALVDGGGGWLLPGLVDAHVHLGPGTARLAAMHGVTTVVDQFSTAELLVDERRRPVTMTSSRSSGGLGWSTNASAAIACTP